MRTDSERIRAFFEQHDGEDDFYVAGATWLMTVVPSCSRAELTVYATKHCVSAMLRDTNTRTPFTLAACTAFPDNAHVRMLARIAGDGPVAFLGDCDPPALLTFAYLRCEMPMRYVGVGDAVLGRLGIRLQDKLTIDLAQAEAEAMPFVHEMLPDLEELAGPECLALLERRRKIETEVLVSCTQLDPEATLRALTA